MSSPPPVYASFWKRFHAYGYDSIIVALIIWMVNSLIGGIANAQSAEDMKALVDAGWLPQDVASNPLSSGMHYGLRQMIDWSDMILPLLVSATYHIGFVVGDWHATPGKRYCGIQVVNADGSYLTWQQAGLRYCGRAFSGMLGGLPFLTALFTREKTAVHDMLCGTRVIRGKSTTPLHAVQPLTHACVLEALRTAQSIKDLPVAPNSPYFSAALRDVSFASQAHSIIAKKISALQSDTYGAQRDPAQTKTLCHWQSMLVRVEQIMANGGTKQR